MAENFTDDQISEFRDAFYMIDKDCDGYITMKELAATVRSIDKSSKKEEVDKMLRDIEMDGEMLINFDEFLDIMGMKTKEDMVDELKEAFRVFDRDRDGFISADEMRLVMHNLGEKITEDEAEQMVRTADIDGDGLVSYIEFAKMMMNAF